MTHTSDCSVHNGPALPQSPCDCGHDTRAKVVMWADAIKTLIAENAPAEKIVAYAAQLNSSAAALLRY